MKRYGAATVVDDLSVAIAPGECLSVIGANGAGKTTPIRLCLGLTAPDAGGVTASGLQMPRDALAIKPHLGVLSQMDTLDPDFSCAGNLLVYGRYFGMRAALAHKANAKPGALSSGMKRRLSLGRALVNNPRLLLVYAVAAFRVALALTRNRFAKQRLLRRAARTPPKGAMPVGRQSRFRGISEQSHSRRRGNPSQGGARPPPSDRPRRPWGDAEGGAGAQCTACCNAGCAST